MKKLIGKVVKYGDYDINTGRDANYGFINGINGTYYVHRKNIDDKDGIQVRDIVYFSCHESSPGKKPKATHVKKLNYRYFMETDLEELKEHFSYLIKIYKNNYELLNIITGYILVLPLKDIFHSDLFQNIYPRQQTTLIEILKERMFKEDTANEFIDALSDLILSGIKRPDKNKEIIKSKIINLKNDSYNRFQEQVDLIIRARNYALDSFEDLLQFMIDNQSHDSEPAFLVLDEILPDYIKEESVNYWILKYTDDDKIKDINTGSSCKHLTEKVCFIIKNKPALAESIDDSIVSLLDIQKMINKNEESIKNWLMKYSDSNMTIWNLLLSNEEKINDISNNPTSKMSKNKFQNLYNNSSVWKNISVETIFKYSFIDLMQSDDKIKLLFKVPSYLNSPNIFSSENERVLFINYIAKNHLEDIKLYESIVTPAPSLSNLAYNIVTGKMHSLRQIQIDLATIAQLSLKNDLSKNLDMTPFLPGCPRKEMEYDSEYGSYIYHCDGNWWPNKDFNTNRVYCYRMRRNGDNYICNIENAHIFPDCNRPYKKWSLLELMVCAGTDKLYYSNYKNMLPNYIIRISGMINWYNSLRKRLYCSVCKEPLIFKFEKGNKKSSVYPRVSADCGHGQEHDHDIYFNYCYNCGAVIDSRESKFKSPTCSNPNMFLCIQCGSPDWNICPKCRSHNMKAVGESNKVRECLDCGHRIYNKKGQQEPYKVRRENIPIVRDLSMRDYK